MVKMCPLAHLKKCRFRFNVTTPIVTRPTVLQTKWDCDDLNVITGTSKRFLLKTDLITSVVRLNGQQLQPSCFHRLRYWQ